MNIALKPDQQKWLTEQVASGAFASVEDAIALAVAGLMSAPDDDDLGWAKPLVDQARGAIARGEGVPASVAQSEVAEQLRRLGGK